MDNTPGPLCACALNKALDASMHSHVVSKVLIPSVMKQPDSKCFREAPVVSFHLTCCSFVMMALVHFKSMASSCGNSTLYTLSILCLAAAQHLGMACTNHWIYIHKGERRVTLHSLLLFYNTLYSNTHVRILGVTFQSSK